MRDRAARGEDEGASSRPSCWPHRARRRTRAPANRLTDHPCDPLRRPHPTPDVQIVWILDRASFYMFTGAQYGWMLAVSSIFATNMIEYSYVSLGLGSVGVMVMLAGWVYARRTYAQVQYDSAKALKIRETYFGFNEAAAGSVVLEAHAAS